MKQRRIVPQGDEPAVFLQALSMDYTDWLLLKAGALALAAFVWGVYCGATGRPLSGRRLPNSKSPH